MRTNVENEGLFVGTDPTQNDLYDKTVVSLFEEQVAQNPKGIAIVFEEKEWTYEALNERVNQLAAHLRKSFDLQSNDLVGLMMDASDWSLTAILAILKSGAAYVPIDPNYPLERKEFIIKDTQIKSLLVKASDANELDAFASILLPVDTFFETVEENKIDHLKWTAPNPSDLAYVIYTSGSTGQSKGVLITHQNLNNYVNGLFERIKIQDCHSFGLMSTLSADLGNTVLYSALLSGGTLHLFSKKSLRDPEYLHTYFKEKAIDCIKIVPSHWNALAFEEAILLPRRMIVFGGETLSLDIVNQIKEVDPTTEVINHYGPTETTIGKLLHEVDFDKNYATIPIGRPFSGSKIYIVNEAMHLCPIGVPGELLIGGEGIAKGYLNRPELSAKKFIVNPFDKKNKSIVYRTGDLVRKLPDGNIEFLGRKDDQVKIRGYRVELGEVENALNGSNSVKQAVVLAQKEDAGLLNLVAYVVPHETFDQSQLQQYLSAKLPDYMVPVYWIKLEELPLNSNGKVDRKGLPEIDFSQQKGNNYIAPRTETEKVLAAIWMKLLKKDKIGIQDHFFEIGGHSLMAIRIISAIRKQLQQKPDLEDIFTHPTIESLAKYLDERTQEQTLPVLIAGERPDRIPLSFAQERLWFIDKLGGSIQYHMPSALRLKNALDKDLLEAAFHDLIDRHEVLRTAYKSEAGKAYQEIMPIENWEMGYYDDPEFKDEELLSKFIYEESIRPFDLSKDYMLRVNLIKCGPEDHLLTLILHHIATDGWSTSILVEELVEIYAAKREKRKAFLKPLPIQYADFAIWQRQYFSEEALVAQLDWWENELKGIEPLMLPTDYPRPTLQSNKGNSFGFHIDKDTTDQLNAISLSSHVTLFMTLQAAFKVLMHRYSGQDDISIGAPLANRNHKEVEPLIGFFLNALTLRSNLGHNPTFNAFLQEVKTTTLAAFKHQEVPFEQIVERVESDRSLSRSPLFQVLFSMRNTPEVPNLELGGIQLSSESTGQDLSQLDLAFYVTEDAYGLSIVVLYCTDLFSDATAEQMGSHFQNILRSIVQNPDQKIAEIPLLSSVEQEQLLIDFNDTPVDFPVGKNAIDLFEEQVEKSPDSIACIYDNKSLTFQELNDKANRLAFFLQTTYDIQANDTIGIMMKRSEWAIISLLGILKAGAAYVPIDLDYPKERKAFIVEDTKMKSLIVHSDDLFKVVVGGFKINVFAVDLQMQILEKEEVISLPMAVLQPNDLAYIIYTSGSTGRPKGVMLEHKGLINIALNLKKWVRMEAGLTSLQFASLTFDASVGEIFSSLIAGGKLILPKQSDILSIDALVQLVNEHQIELLTLPSSYLALIKNDVPSIKTILSAGEALNVSVVGALQTKGIRVLNGYGPTENTVGIAISDDPLLANKTATVGKPFCNVKVYILDKHNNLLPIGVSGELCVSGVQVARGYLNLPELTDEKFIPNPFPTPGNERIYKTGDLARWQPDGRIELLGRIDDQVKIRGYRTELGEIENVLIHSPDVKNCAVLAKPDENGVLNLVAYVVPETTFDRIQLQSYLTSKLPDYMVPGLWVEMDAFPLTTAGKINKKILPEPDIALQATEEYVAPRNETEEILAKSWAKLLKVDKIGMNDNFFLLGGHSLLAMRLLADLKEKFELNIPLKVIFEYPTISELQKYIRLMDKTDEHLFDESEAVEL